MESGECRVRVFARVRPPGPNELFQSVDVDHKSCSVRVRGAAAEPDGTSPQRGGTLLAPCAAEGGSAEARHFTFDAVFDGGATQQDLFAKVGAPILQGCLNGLNGTIFAYGQTGSGKTYSLLHRGQRTEDAGLLPRVVAGLFAHIARDDEHVYDVQAAAVQLYNEQVDDLLRPEHELSGTCGHSASHGGSHLHPLSWEPCRTPERLLHAFERARSNLVYAETKMNKVSSRSHAIFQIRIEKRQKAVESPTGSDYQMMECVRAQLNVVDLAGSERVKKSGAEGAQLKEAMAINKSLLAFGNVVSALAAKRPHIPYRDSKLTKLLETSIGGNCRTALLVCAGPAAENAGETLGSLEFASRAMRVEVDAKVNTGTVVVSAKELMVESSRQLEELVGASLKAELDELRRTSEEALKRAEEQARGREKDLESANAVVSSLRAELQENTEKIRCFSNDVERWAEERQRFLLDIEHLRSALALAEEGRDEAVARSRALRAELDQALDEVQALKLRTVGVEQEAELAAASTRLAQQDLERFMAEASAREEQLARDCQDAEKRACKAEQDLETELESIMAEIEASAEIETQRQQAAENMISLERRNHASRLQAAVAEVEDWRAQALECMRRVEALESRIASTAQAGTTAIGEWHGLRVGCVSEPLAPMFEGCVGK